MSIGSSLGATERSFTPRLIDVIVALEKQGIQDRADYYKFVLLPFLSLAYNTSADSLMLMTLDGLLELSQLPQKPIKYIGWETFHFGRAAFVDND